MHHTLSLPVPSGYPRDIVAVVSGPRTLHLTWSPPALDEQNGFIVQYGINITDIQNGEFVQFTVRDYATSLTIPDLHPYYYYNYTVTAFTLVGNGPYSPTGYIQMPEDGIYCRCTHITICNYTQLLSHTHTHTHTRTHTHTHTHTLVPEYVGLSL